MASSLWILHDSNVVKAKGSTVSKFIMFMAYIYIYINHENMSGLWHCFASGKMMV